MLAWIYRTSALSWGYREVSSHDRTVHGTIVLCPCTKHLTQPNVINQLVSEIRNRIYDHVLKGDAVKLVRSAPLATRNSFLPLSRTCKQIHDELLSWFQKQTTVSIWLTSLNRYLRTFHPLSAPSVDYSVKLRVMFPGNTARDAWRYVPYTDITHLYKLTSQHTNFTLSIASCAPPAPGLLDPADIVFRQQPYQALEAALSRLASAPLPVSEGILAVRIVILPAKSLLWLVFKQHTVLPGEWPWYGALDLHGESVKQWQRWLGENGLAEVKGWDVQVMVRQSHRDVPGFLLMGWSREEYLAVPEREALEEGEWEGREWERETLRLSAEGGGRWDWAGWERACQARAENVRRARAEREAERELEELVDACEGIV
jgi:hypothetical protein